MKSLEEEKKIITISPKGKQMKNSNRCKPIPRTLLLFLPYKSKILNRIKIITVELMHPAHMYGENGRERKG